MITEQGPIYVHCAFGHGRSATFAAAWLILKGHVQGKEKRGVGRGGEEGKEIWGEQFN